MRMRVVFSSLLLAATLATSASAAPLASGASKFLGSAYSPQQAPGFAQYWNKLTPENSGKWGSVEAVRDQMDWSGLDTAYRLAKANGMPFQMHVMVWGNQQPEWIKALPPAEQRREIEQWFAAVAQRYPQIDLLEVVNEPLNDPPSKDDTGGGNYLQALGGNGASGWEWVLQSFRLARQHFPRARLMINDYSITNNPQATQKYLQIVQLLQREQLIDAIGIQEHAFETTPNVAMSVHRANLDALAATGLPIYITEFDLDGPSDAQQLADYQRVFPVFWEHPRRTRYHAVGLSSRAVARQGSGLSDSRRWQRAAGADLVASLRGRAPHCYAVNAVPLISRLLTDLCPRPHH